MKRIPLIALISAALFLTGCLITSVYPFYSGKTSVFEPALLGQWRNVHQPGERWMFEQKGENAYLLTYVSGGKISVLNARSFQLRGHLFLDLFFTDLPADIQPPPIPSHMLLRVFQMDPTLKLAPLDYPWLTRILAENPAALRHHVIKSGDRPPDRRIVLTAETAELQQFIIQHLNTSEAWADSLELKRESLTTTSL